MAFPIIASTNSWFASTNTTTHTINLPSGISNWDLLIVLFTLDAGNATTPSWWNLISHTTTSSWDAPSFSYYRVADWTEGSTFTITSTWSENSAHYSYRITGANTTISLNSTWISYSSTWGQNWQPNPPSLSPARWASDTLWIVIWSTENTPSWWTAPTSYSWWFISSWTWTSRWHLWYGSRSLNASSEDPWNFTTGTQYMWTAGTIAIQPAPLSTNKWNFFLMF